MKVSFNTNYTKIRFCNNNTKNTDIAATAYDKEIKKAKVKKAVSECSTIAVAVGILYFAMKRNFKFNRIKNANKKLEEAANVLLPEIKMTLPPKDSLL